MQCREGGACGDTRGRAAEAHGRARSLGNCQFYPACRAISVLFGVQYEAADRAETDNDHAFYTYGLCGCGHDLRGHRLEVLGLTKFETHRKNYSNPPPLQRPLPLQQHKPTLLLIFRNRSWPFRRLRIFGNFTCPSWNIESVCFAIGSAGGAGRPLPYNSRISSAL